MTNKELREQLALYPDDLVVLVQMAETEEFRDLGTIGPVRQDEEGWVSPAYGPQAEPTALALYGEED